MSILIKSILSTFSILYQSSNAIALIYEKSFNPILHFSTFTIEVAAAKTYQLQPVKANVNENNPIFAPQIPPIVPMK